MRLASAFVVALGLVLVAAACNDTSLKAGVTLDAGLGDLAVGPVVDLALPAPDGGGVIGSDCVTGDDSLGAGNCMAGLYCLTAADGYPGGICVAECSDEVPCPGDTVCAGTSIAGAAGCFPACKVDKDCRKGYSCSQRTGACRPNQGGQPQLPVGTTETGEACVMQPTDPPASGWTTPVKVAAMNHYSTTTQLAFDAVGKRLFAVWYDFSQQSDSISYAISSDEGATFGAPLQLPRDNTNSQTEYVDLPSVTSDAAGSVYAAWLGYSTDDTGMNIGKMNVFVARATTGQSTMAPIGRPTPTTEFVTDGGIGGPFIAASPKDGELAVTWTQLLPTNMERNIRLARSTDHGATWSAPVTVSDTAARPTNVRGRARPAYSATGELYVAWVEYVDQPFGAIANGIYVQRYGADGAAIGTNVEVSGDTDSPGYEVPSLAVLGSTVAVVFGSGDETGAWDIRLVHSLDSGASWQPSVKLNDDATCATHFRATTAFDAAGLLHTVWYDNRYLSGNVFYTTATLGGSGGPVVAANSRVSAMGFRFSTSVQGFNVLSDYLGLAVTPTAIYTSFTAPAPMMPPVPIVSKLAVGASNPQPDLQAEPPADMAAPDLQPNDL